MKAFIEEILQILKNSQKFEDIELLLAYPNRMRPYPMKKPSLVLQAENLSFKEAAVGRLVAKKEDVQDQTIKYCGENIQFLLKTDVLVDDSKDIMFCWGIFERMVAVLLENKVNCQEVTCIKVVHEPKWGAFHLSGALKSAMMAIVEETEEGSL